MIMGIEIFTFHPKLSASSMGTYSEKHEALSLLFIHSMCAFELVKRFFIQKYTIERTTERQWVD